MEGVVKFFNDSKGFGFIESKGMEDIFVHRTGLDSSLQSLSADQKVVFETKKSDRGLIAVNVKLDI